MTRIDISKFEKLEASGALPSPKGVALATIQLCNSHEPSLIEVGRLVMADPAFVGRLLRLANHQCWPDQRPVIAISQALTCVGIDAVRDLALKASMVSQESHNICAEFDYPEFWSSSLAAGLSMRTICEHISAMTPEEGFTLGLLSRTGELALSALFPDEYSAILALARQPMARSLKDLERDRFAMNHSELGAAILAEWGLPKVLRDAMFYHENVRAAPFPEGSRESRIALSLTLSRILARHCLGAELATTQGQIRALKLAERLGLRSDAVDDLLEQIKQTWFKWCDEPQTRTLTLPRREELIRVPPPGAKAPVQESQSAMRVLIVDDDPVMRALVRKVVEKAGHQVFQAGNGKEGLEMALECHPHMMIVDWLMPEMDGMALTRALRRTSGGRSIYVLILTSLEDDEFLIQAFENGVDDYLAKPLKQKILAARLRAGQRVVSLHRELAGEREEALRVARELSVTNHRLQEAALTDPLTGLPNRRYAMETLLKEWANSSTVERPLTCMLIDLDGFKPVNDTYGHDVGDSVLVQAASVLKRSLREQDQLCRIGGDEFLVVCPGTSLEQATVCGERIRSAVEACEFHHEGVPLPITVSIGAAIRTMNMPNVDALIKRADESLYRAKQRGRNQIAID